MGPGAGASQAADLDLLVVPRVRLGESVSLQVRLVSLLLVTWRSRHLVYVHHWCPLKSFLQECLMFSRRNHCKSGRAGLGTSPMMNHDSWISSGIPSPFMSLVRMLCQFSHSQERD